MPRRKDTSTFGRILRWTGKILGLLVVVTALEVLVLRFVNPPFTTMSLWKRIRHGQVVRVPRSRRMWRPLRKISPHLRKAVLAGEDQRFLSHHGFDLTEMNEAFTDILEKRGFRGASTITMQVARTVFLWPKRSWFRKAAEAYYTLLVEAFWSKQRILEIYLNMVDWGRGVMGAEAASKKYFHVSSSVLSRKQAALLAAILPNPRKWSPVRPNAQVLKRQQRILRDMGKMPLLS